jgi:hypothetical protein
MPGMKYPYAWLALLVLSVCLLLPLLALTIIRSAARREVARAAAVQFGPRVQTRDGFFREDASKSTCAIVSQSAGPFGRVLK